MQRLARFTIQQEHNNAIQLLSHYDELIAIIMRHLPPSTATLFARPEIKEEGKIVEWYSDLQGQPYLLKDSITDQQKLSSIQPLIESRLNAIKQLAQTLSHQGHITPQQSNLLTQLVDGASHDTKQIYIINNDPVIVGWGVGKKPATPPPVPPVTSPVSHRWCWWLLPLLLLLLGLLLWWYFFLRLPEKLPEPVKAEPVIEQPKEKTEPKPTQTETLPAEEEKVIPPKENLVPPEAEPIKEDKTVTIPTKKCTISTKPGETPQMAIIFDNSSSMLFTLLESKQTIDQFQQFWMHYLPTQEQVNYMRRSPNRLEVAKKSSANIINNIAKSVDIGLIELRGCPAATNHGFYHPNQRKQLRAKINSMYPEPDNSNFGGTPLYNGLQKAANMLDGRNRDGFILLLSDGQDSCDSPNICVLAKEIARKQPKLKINVVDIGGAEAANCVATATGGKIFTANNQKQLVKMINQAVKPLTEEEVCQ